MKRVIVWYLISSLVVLYSYGNQTLDEQDIPVVLQDEDSQEVEVEKVSVQEQEFSAEETEQDSEESDEMITGIEQLQEDEDDIDLGKVAVEEESGVSIDTMDLEDPQGNWLFKRHWWKRANKMYERIDALVEQAFDSRSQFVRIQNEIEDDLLEPFYRTVGISQGSLNELVTSLMDRLKKWRKEKGILTEEEKEFLESLEAHQDTMEQLQADMQGVNQLDTMLENSIKTVMEQLNLTRTYKQRAWDYLKEIEHELSDQRARELVFEMKALEKNIKAILSYLTGSFSTYFEQLSQSAYDQVDRIKQAVQDLRESGVDLKREVQKFEGVEAEPQEVKEELGWWQRFSNWVRSLFGW